MHKILPLFRAIAILGSVIVFCLLVSFCGAFVFYIVYNGLVAPWLHWPLMGLWQAWAVLFIFQMIAGIFKSVVNFTAQPKRRSW